MRVKDRYPVIINAYPLKDYNLFIEWSSGEQTIFDATEFLDAHSAVPFKSFDLFRQVKVDPHFLYWGDEEFIIMRDAIYDSSFPFSAIVTASGLSFLSMSRVKVTTPFPIAKLAFSTRMFVHGNEANSKSHGVHVHVMLNNTIDQFPFKLDGISAIPGLEPPNPLFSGKVRKAITKWISDNLPEIVKEWNKENVDSPIDDKGVYIK
jgi:hypothetical protein